MNKHIDILIENDDIALDEHGIPIMVNNQLSIIQDIKHTIRESGLLPQLIAERSREKRGLIEKKIEILVEEDDRLIPGTITFQPDKNAFLNGKGVWVCTAKTVDFGNVSTGLVNS